MYMHLDISTFGGGGGGGGWWGIVCNVCLCCSTFHCCHGHRTVRGDHTLYIHPSSVLFEQRSPSWVVFNEVIQTSKQYMRDVTVVRVLLVSPTELFNLKCNALSFLMDCSF